MPRRETNTLAANLARAERFAKRGDRPAVWYGDAFNDGRCNSCNSAERVNVIRLGSQLIRVCGDCSSVLKRHLKTLP